ncbi:MAG: LacI family DNA-binding transcriptional regulator [Geminicoccaceae bacterium]|nr:MAG: LacI family DNA-binding transcriptional regulator [Geminicoccaceae bacterium]
MAGESREDRIATTAEAAPPRRKPRLLDVAERAGFSRAAVSLALRGDPSIPEATRTKILEAAKDLAYVYNRGAANLRRASTLTVGIVLHDVTNPYFAEILAALQQEFAASGRVVLFGNSDEDTSIQARIIRTFREYNVDGLVLCPAAGTERAALAQVQRSGCPLVLFSRAVPGVEVDYVGGANRAGMGLAIDHLLASGHRRIALIGGNTKTTTGRERREGYLEALERAGLPPAPELILSGPPTRDLGVEGITALLRLPAPPTAVVGFNDIVAFGVMLGARRHGLDVGRDLAVVGFDDVREATLWRPALTSVWFDREVIGRAATRLLLRRIADPSAPIERVAIPPALRVRDSSAPTSG